ncbi:cytochrome P450 4C1-like [Schistocerca serialis cubense]|uniref:cytochrome P450 4C1-like n=1 Tax=Schistocerca serialis cubense TaxID=2023355 RepID=UPI00214F4586|nr:cytochrome P450 4C1-like [Schistocerca serialis cubense]
MLGVSALLLAALVVAVTAIFISRMWRVWTEIDKLPGEMALPLLGNTYRVFFLEREDFVAYLDQMTKTYWPLYRVWLGFQPDVHVVKPEHIEKIMTSSELITKSHVYHFLEPWLGQGLLTSTGAKWHSRRKMITPAFHFSILDNFTEVFAEKSEVLVDILKTKADGEIFDIYPYITRCALDIICETAMGTSVNAQKNLESAYVTSIYRVGEITVWRILSPWLQSDFIFRISPSGREFYKQLKVLHGFSQKVIQEKKKARMTVKIDGKTPQYDELGRKRRVAFLDLLLTESEQGQKLTDEEIQEEVDTFMFEGHDTTTAGMTWVLLLLGHHTEIQEKVYAELRDLFQDDPKRQPTMQDLHNMKYLEMVIKESLRLYPSVPFIARKATQDVEIGGYNIPEGTMLTMNIIHTHRDPDHWPDPERFDPDRFLPENIQKRHPFAFVPFSGGPRNCIGQKFAILEEKTVLSYILRHFRVQTVERLEDLKLMGELVLRPFSGVKLRLWPR